MKYFRVQLFVVIIRVIPGNNQNVHKGIKKYAQVLDCIVSKNSSKLRKKYELKLK